MSRQASQPLNSISTEQARPAAGLFRRTVNNQLARVRGGGFRLRDGTDIRLFGDRESGIPTVTVHDQAFYRMVALGGSLGAADAYRAGLWSTDNLVGLLRLFVRNSDATDQLERGTAWARQVVDRFRALGRRNTVAGSRRNIHEHYDLGNDFFRLFLDETMTYSAAFFDSEKTSLADAQRRKLDRLCRMLDLQPEHHLLEIGTGWGSMALHAASRYGCRVTTTTISREQHALATETVRVAGLADRVNVLLKDYRSLNGRYDRIVSVEMIEAVGERFLPSFFSCLQDRLTDDGLAAIQAITMPEHRLAQYRRTVDFIRRDIFPGSFVPSMGLMLNAVGAGSDFRLAGFEEMGLHYERTLALWRERFHDRLDDVRALGLTDEFIRLWDFYLAYCEAGFAERYIGSVQFLLARPGYRETGVRR